MVSSTQIKGYSHTNHLRLHGAVLNQRWAALVLVTRIERLVLGETAARLSHNIPHELCTALWNEQAVTNEGHGALGTVPKGLSVLIFLGWSTVDALIEEPDRMASRKSEISGHGAMHVNFEVAKLDKRPIPTMILVTPSSREP